MLWHWVEFSLEAEHLLFQRMVRLQLFYEGPFCFLFLILQCKKAINPKSLRVFISPHIFIKEKRKVNWYYGNRMKGETVRKELMSHFRVVQAGTLTSEISAEGANVHFFMSGSSRVQAESWVQLCVKMDDMTPTLSAAQKWSQNTCCNGCWRINAGEISW